MADSALDPTPVFFFSHGTTMMLGEESQPAEFWKTVGDEAHRRGIKSIVMMGTFFFALYVPLARYSLGISYLREL